MQSPVFVRLDPEAPLPVRSTDGSVGYDFYITKLMKYDEKSGLYYFHTGWSIRSPPGYFPLVFPRSSLPKTGFFMANSVGVFDLDYQGELIVCLAKHDICKYFVNTSIIPCPKNHVRNLLKDGPVKAVQAVFLPAPYMGEFVIEDKSERVETKTERGEGGFGSTGN